MFDICKQLNMKNEYNVIVELHKKQWNHYEIK